MGYGRLALDIDLSQTPGAAFSHDTPPDLGDAFTSLDFSAKSSATSDANTPALDESPLALPSMPMLDFDLGEEITLTARNVSVEDSPVTKS